MGRAEWLFLLFSENNIYNVKGVVIRSYLEQAEAFMTFVFSARQTLLS